MAEGVAGVTRDKTRKPGKPPLAVVTVQRVVDLALSPPREKLYGWFTEGFDTLDLKEGKALLDELAG